MIDVKKLNFIQWVSIALIVFLIINLVLFAFKKGNTLYFWIFIALAAIYAFFVLPIFMKGNAGKIESKKEKKGQKEEKDEGKEE